LGSALATIGALDIRTLFGHVDQLYTFGEPRVGNEAFASYVTSSIPERYRIIHYADIVPHVPPQLPIPYAHFAS
jgi:predicted lipase